MLARHGSAGPTWTAGRCIRAGPRILNVVERELALSTGLLAASRRRWPRRALLLADGAADPGRAAAGRTQAYSAAVMADDPVRRPPGPLRLWLSLRVLDG